MNFHGVFCNKVQLLVIHSTFAKVLEASASPTPLLRSHCREYFGHSIWQYQIIVINHFLLTFLKINNTMAVNVVNNIKKNRVILYN